MQHMRGLRPQRQPLELDAIWPQTATASGRQQQPRDSNSRAQKRHREQAHASIDSRQQAQWPETQILDTGTPELDRNAGISHRVASTAVMMAEDRLDVGDTCDARIGARAVKTGCAIIYL